jgi:hypothetical protein
LTDEVDLDLADGSKMNFGFNVKWNKSLTNLQGQFTSILRTEDGTPCRVKSTVTNTLLVNPVTDQATFTAKANLINQATGYSLGGLTMIVNMTDVGEPGSQEMAPDTIGFTLWNGPTLIFSTHWNGSATLEQGLAGGNVQVHFDELNLAGDPATVAQVGAPLIGAALEPVVRQAIGIWSQSGLDQAQLSLLDRVEVRTASLNGTTLGATFGATVWIDLDAAGYGWRVDRAAPAGSTYGDMDLLSVVTHELGHVLGLGHDDPYDVMAATLAPRLRTVNTSELPWEAQHAGASLYPPASPSLIRLRFPSVRDTFSLPESDTQWGPAAGAQALGVRDQFFASLATEANLAALLANRPRSIRLEAGSAEAIGDYAELLAELTDREGSAVDAVQESLLDEDLNWIDLP